MKPSKNPIFKLCFLLMIFFYSIPAVFADMEGTIQSGDAQPRVDLAFFNKVLKPDDVCHGFVMNGINDVLDILKARTEASKKTDFGKPVETDLILWAVGKPEKPWFTHVGGSPYRPKSSPWPVIQGSKAVFIMQWCFADSKDIVSKNLPGDVLLMFAGLEGQDSFIPDPENIYFEWQKLGVQDISETVEPGTVKIPELHGCLFRFSEFPASAESPDETIQMLAITQASRIGGDTRYIQNTFPKEDEVLLCTMNSIHFEPVIPYPFLNHPEPLEDKEDYDQYHLSIGDFGCLYVFLNKQGTIRSEWDCY